MSNADKGVSVRILDKDFTFACPDNEKDGLIASAQLLNNKMLEIRDTGKVIGMDRIAVMAALNLAHELLRNSTKKSDYHLNISNRIRQLQDKIEVALTQGNQLEL